MEVTRQELNPCTIQLQVKVAPDKVREGFDRAFRKITKEVRVPGFRPGHAPKHMLEAAVQPQHLYEVAADIIIRDNFRKALESEKLEPHSQPSVEVTTINKDEEVCEFTAKVPLPPQVNLTDYKGLKAERPPIDVQDDEVQAQIDELRQKEGKRMPVTERGIMDGDVAVVNIKLEGEEGDGRNFMTIAGKTFPELDAALSGMRSDEIKSLELTFPANFQEKDWVGKTLKCHVSIRSISAVQMPELDAEFVKGFDVDSVDDLKGRVREAILRAKESMAVDFINEQLLEGILSKSTIHVPDTMWEQVAVRRLQDLQQEQAQKGKSMDDYAKESGMSIDEMVNAWKDEARLHVQRAVVVQKIFEEEKLQLTNEDFNRELHLMAREYNADPKELLAAMQKQNAMQELQFRAVFRKVTDFLRENAKIEDGKPAEKPKSKSSKK